MAEGFLKLENDSEGEAGKCLQELVDRCLVLICKKSRDGTKFRSCKVHDLIYDLCVTELQRENILIMNDIVLGVSERGNLSMQKMQPFKCVTGDEINYCPYGLYRALLTPVHRQLRDHDNNVLIWLRYLSLYCRENLDIPPEICRLWNLQTFIVQGLSQFVKITCPEEIWGLMQLRHLKLPEFYLPNHPSVSVEKGSHMGFSNIRTISYLSPRCCTKEVIMGIQNVKELGICGYKTDSNSIRDTRLLNNLVNLQQLETLSFTYCYSRILPASAKAYPATLKKLKLRLTPLSWSYLDIIAELPNLEVLKLVDCACIADKWYPNVRGFNRLKILLVNDCFLKYRKATDHNFPILERLVLNDCHNLKEIPIEFAEIYTLQLIKLSRCLPELEESAARIQKEQEDLENNPVDVRISDPCK
ncbi:hypothetical protein P3L10_019901 [Capsicum annuum]